MLFNSYQWEKQWPQELNMKYVMWAENQDLCEIYIFILRINLTEHVVLVDKFLDIHPGQASR